MGKKGCSSHSLSLEGLYVPSEKKGVLQNVFVRAQHSHLAAHLPEERMLKGTLLISRHSSSQAHDSSSYCWF